MQLKIIKYYKYYRKGGEGTYFYFRTRQPSRYRSTHQRCSVENVVLKIFAKFTVKHLCQCQRLFFNKIAVPRQRVSGTGVFIELCETSKYTFFAEHLRTTASVAIDWFKINAMIVNPDKF